MSTKAFSSLTMTSFGHVRFSRALSGLIFIRGSIYHVKTRNQ
jgi:hypothetical protein